MAVKKEQIDFEVNGKGNAPSFFEKVGDSLKNLKKVAGEESTLGGLGKLAVGAGAVAGFTVVGRALADASAKAIELKEAFKDGSISAGQFADELAKGIPIIGKFWEFGRNIRELITGEEAEQKKFNAAMDAGAAAMSKLETTTRSWRKELEEALRLLPNRAFMGGLDETGRAFFSQSEALRQAKNQAGEKFVGRINSKEVTALQESIDALEKRRTKLIREHTTESIAEAKSLYPELERRREALRGLLETARQGRDTEITNAFAQARAGAVLGAMRGAWNGLQQDAQNPTTLLGKVASSIDRFSESFGGGAKEFFEQAQKAKVSPEQMAKQAYDAYEKELDDRLDLNMSIADSQKEIASLQMDLAEATKMADPRFSGGLAGTDSSRFLSGVGAASRENNPLNKIVPLNEKQVALLDQISKATAKMAQAEYVLAQFEGAD